MNQALAPRKEVLLILLLAVLLTLPAIGSKPFISHGEGREGIVADSIVHEGKWLLPSGYGDNVPSKPPMIHWLAALFSLPQGYVSEFTMRLPSALSSIILSLSFYIFLRRRLARDISTLSVVILLTSIEWWRAAVAARVDMVLSAALVGALLSLFTWEERKLKGIPITAWLCLVIATLTKGPVALVLALGIFGCYLLICEHALWRIVIKLLLLSLLSLVPPLLWYLAAYQTGGDKFLDMVWSENFARFAGTMEDRPHEHSAFYLLGTLIIGFMPWTILLLSAGFRALLKLKQFSFRSFNPAALLIKLKRSSRCYAFACIAVVIVFMFYCVPAGKRSVYLLPLYPFLSLFLATGLLQLSKQYEKQQLALLIALTALVAVLLLTMLCLGFGILPLTSLSTTEFQYWIVFLGQYVAALKFQDILLIVAPLVLALIILVPAWRRYYDRSSYEWLAVLQILLLLFLNGSLLGQIAIAVSPKEFVSKVTPLIAENARVFSFNDRLFDIDFYLQQKVYEAKCETAFKQGDNIFVDTERLSQLNSCLHGKYSTKLIAQSSHGIGEPDRLIQLYLVE